MFKSAFVSDSFLMRRKITQNKRSKKIQYCSFSVLCSFLVVTNNTLKQKKIEIVFDLLKIVAEIGFEPMPFGL